MNRNHLRARQARVPSLLTLVSLLGLQALASAQAGDHLVHLGSLVPGTVSVQRVGYVYHLRFDGDEHLDYQINLADHPVTHGMLRVYEASSASWPIHDGGAAYLLANGQVGGPAYLTVYTTLTDSYATADSVVLEFADNADGGSHHRRYTFRLQGKALTIRAQDLDASTTHFANFCGLLTGPTQAMESPTYLPIQGALATPIVSFLNGSQRWFYGEMLDMPASHSADYFLDKDPIPAGATSVNSGMHTANGYKRQSNGRNCAALDDTITLTLSTRLRDVLVQPTQAASPYRELLASRLMLTLPNNHWQDYSALWTSFDSWGMDEIAGYFFHWSSGGPDGPGSDNLGPDWYPATDAQNFSNMAHAGVAKGYLLGGYMAFNLMPSSAPPGIYDVNQIARTDTLAPKLCVQNGVPMLATSASALNAARECNLASQMYGLNMGYLDVQTYASPSKGADGDHLDQRSGSRLAATLGRALYEQKRWMKGMADTLHGPLVGEGSIATRDSEMEWLWAGYCDSVQRVINTDRGLHASEMPAGDPASPTLWPLMPEFELRVMQRLQVNHGNGFPDRFFSRSDGPGFVNMTTGQPLYPMNEAMLDRYRVYEISYGKSSSIQCNGPFDGIGNYTYIADVVKEYYLMNELQRRYCESPISAIEYFDAGSFKTAEQMLGASGATDGMRDPRLHLRYTNGLEVYANHAPASWTLSIAGVSYTIPEDGFVAVQPGTSFIAFSAIAPGTSGARIDYCNAPGRYEFFDGRGLVSGHGGIDTGGIKRLKVRNDVHAITVTEQTNGTLLATQGSPPAVVNVTVTPASLSLAQGGRVGLHAIAHFANGAWRDVTTLVNWSSSNSLVAAINEGAALTGLSGGSAQINCTSFGGSPVVPASVVVQ